MIAVYLNIIILIYHNSVFKLVYVYDGLGYFRCVFSVLRLVAFFPVPPRS